LHMSTSDDRTATAKSLILRQKRPPAGSRERFAHGQDAMRTPPAVGGRDPTGREAGVAAGQQTARINPPRRNKLAFKNRWLISVDIIAALRRAGVICDIVVPVLYADAPGLTRH